MKRGNALPAALVLSAVVACAEPRAGSLPPPTSPTPTLTATATPTPGAEDARAELRRAIARYFDALNASLRRPAVAAQTLAPLIDPACSCRRILTVLDDLARQDRYLDYSYRVSDIRVQQLGAVGASVTYRVRQSAGHERASDGRIVRSFAGSSARYSAHFKRVGGAWLIDRSDVMR